MSSTDLTLDDSLPRETLAWRIVVGAFVAFLVMCGGTVYVTQWYVWQSQVPMRVQLDVARGTVRVQDARSSTPTAYIDSQRIDDGATVLTDSTSQAVISFVDPTTGTVVGSYTLFQESEMRVKEVGSPRFLLSQGEYTIHLEQVAGRGEYYAAVFSDSSTISIDTPQGTVAIRDAGQYLVDTNAEETAVSAQAGEAWAGGESVQAGQQAQLRPDETVITEQTNISLLQGGRFAGDYLAVWDFYHNGPREGQQADVIYRGRDAVRLSRSQTSYATPIEAHGETGFVQALGIDVSSYEWVELRASFSIEEQSLSTCGQQGSECPIMLRVSYIAEDGSEQELVTGFYHTFEPQAPYPLACASCRTEHTRINMHTWYTYESGNLMTTLPDAVRPQRIVRAQIYASGWAYEVHIGEFNLLVQP